MAVPSAWNLTFPIARIVSNKQKLQLLLRITDAERLCFNNVNFTLPLVKSVVVLTLMMDTHVICKLYG